MLLILKKNWIKSDILAFIATVMPSATPDGEIGSIYPGSQL
jgi:hypothetical protein